MFSFNHLFRCLSSAFVIAILLISVGCGSKTVVKKLSTEDSKTSTKKINGFLYHLPLTVVRVSIPMKMQKQTPGEFSDFAPCFFRAEVADKRVTSEKRTVTIDNPTFSSAGIADLKETYVVKTSGAYFQSLTVSGTLNKEGNLTEGSFESKDETIPIAIKIAETAIELGAKAIPVLGLDATSNPFSMASSILSGENDCISAGLERQSKIIARRRKEIQSEIDRLKMKQKELRAEKRNENDPLIKQIENEIVALATSGSKLSDEETKWTERKVATNGKLDELKKELKQNLSEGKLSDDFRPPASFYINLVDAAKAFQELAELQKKRSEIEDKLTDVNPDVYKTRLKELDDKISKLLSEFLGKQETLAWTGNFEFNPGKDQKDNGRTDGIDFNTLFTYSKSGGICVNSPFNTQLVNDGILVSNDFKTKCDDKSELTDVQIYADRQSNDTEFLTKINTAKEFSKNDTSGWRFRIPAKATVALMECEHRPQSSRCAKDEFIEYGRDKIMIAQYGEIVAIPAKTAGRTSSSSVSLDDTTGALKNFKASSSPAIDKSVIDDAQKTAEKVIDASDPLTKKKRELDLLKTQNEINEERKKLETPSPTPSPTP
jgi:hypothetical protein